MSGHGFQFSEGDQTFLHAFKRRWKNSRGNGFARARHRGNRRRQPARREARNTGGKYAPAQNGSRRLQMVSRSAALRHGTALRVRPRLRANADVHHRCPEHPRRDSIRTHTWQRRVLTPLSFWAQPRKLLLFTYPEITAGLLLFW